MTVSAPSNANALLQFSLRALLLLVAIVAGCLVLFQIATLWAILLTGAILLIALYQQRNFWSRFLVACLIMVGINLLPLYFSSTEFIADGYERVGWPFKFYERGGFSYQESIGLHWLIADGIIAMAIACFTATILKNGWRALIHHLRTWGLKDRT